MILEELEGMFGKFNPNEEKWVNENLMNLDEEQKGEFIQELNKSGEKPNISSLQKTLQKVTGQKPKTYFWAVCLECGCEYDYGLPMCPACYDRGFDCRAKAVKKSEFKPPMKVIKYNKQYLNGNKGEQTCFSCHEKKESFCPHFGNPDWNCHREEFEYCNCKVCCGKTKSENRKLSESKQNRKYSYAVALKKAM